MFAEESLTTPVSREIVSQILDPTVPKKHRRIPWHSLSIGLIIPSANA